MTLSFQGTGADSESGSTADRRALSRPLAETAFGRLCTACSTTKVDDMDMYLDCGCYIDESGHRAFCPSCDCAYLLKGRVATNEEKQADEICRLVSKVDDLETEVQDQKQVRRWLEGAIMAFAAPHMRLDDESTPADEYDQLLSDWTAAAHALVDVYMALAISECDNVLGDSMKKDGE